MKTRWCASVPAILALAALAMQCSLIGTACAQTSGEEVLTQGPVHEAFAEVVQLTPQPGIVVSNEPPQAVEEMPPDERPMADNVVWIPGYWAWDDDRNDFIWVSGVWRVPPPDRTWVPGYWNRVEGGWQWICGFWAPVDTQELEYLPPVPESLETGPNSPLPGGDYLWMAGCWRWNQNRYVWGPGYWGQVRTGRVLVPAHYIWTCRGCVFVPEYWDYAPEYRGVLFAPVYFPRPWFGLFGRRTHRHHPSICIDVANLWNNLFCRPRYGHYYFGDYYDAGYARRGIYPWFERSRARTWYSPFCAYAEWTHERERPHWLEGVRRDFDDRRAHPQLRPAHTYQAMEAAIRRQPERDRDRLSFARPLTSYSANPKGAFRFERVSADLRQKAMAEGRERHELAAQRARWESGLTKPGKEFQPTRVKFPRTATAERVSPPPGPPQQRPPREEGFTPGVKRESEHETKTRRVQPPPPPAPEATSRQKSHGDAGPAPGGAPPGKHGREKKTDIAPQPPPPADQTHDKGKDDTKGKRKGDSHD